MSEYILGKHLREWHVRDARQISFIVTQNCNLRCKYCYMVNKNDDNKMTLQVAKDAIDYFLDNQEELFGDDCVILDFIGGEPLMEIDLIDEITDYFKLETYRRHSSWFGRYRISISTNGLLYSHPKVQRYIMKNKDNISIGISIDGTKDKHDMQRVYPDGRGSYEDVEKNVKLWLKQYPDASTKVTIGHDDLKYVKDSIVHLWNLGIKFVPANTVFENVWEDGDDKIFELQLKELADYIIDNKLWNKYSTTLFGENIGFKQIEEEMNKNFCGTGRAYAVDSNGNLYPCVRYVGYSLENKDAILFGNIYTGINKDHIRPFKILTAKVQSPKQCIDCPVSSGCAYCQAYNYDSSVHNTNFERATYSCIMHKARVRANIYYWAKLYNKYNIKRHEDVEINRYYEKQMYFMLNDSCSQLCSNYNISDNNSIMKKDTLIDGLRKATEEFYQPVFLHSSYENFIEIYNDKELLEELERHFIKHIAPYSMSENEEFLGRIKIQDLIVTINKDEISRIKESRVRNCILLIKNSEMSYLSEWIKKIISCFDRVNLKCAIESIQELEKYEEQLFKVEEILLEEYRNNHFCEINVLTDRLYMTDMNNCFAGEKNITIAPDGNYYTCPAFYYSKIANNVEFEMTKIEKAPICKECDTYQCERCVFLNKVRTNEYNIPSMVQCLKAHKERKIIKDLKKRLEERFPNIELNSLENIDYEDPCNKVIKMWNLI